MLQPELFQNAEYAYNEQVDVFSFGIVLAETIARVSADPETMPRTCVFLNSELVFGWYGPLQFGVFEKFQSLKQNSGRRVGR